LGPVFILREASVIFATIIGAVVLDKRLGPRRISAVVAGA